MNVHITHTQAWESCEGLGEQLSHMSGDGLGEEQAFLTNVADAQRQCAHCFASLKACVCVCVVCVYVYILTLCV